MNRWLRFSSYVVVAMALIASAPPAHAYIGPGAGLAAIGTLIAFVGAVLFAIVGFVWYPIKRLLRKKRQTAAATGPVPDTQAPPGDATTRSR